jgi:hypothetical protein
LCIDRGNRKTGGGAVFNRNGSRGPKSYDNTETVVLYIIYNTPFSASVVQRKENLFCSLHKMMKTGELFVVYSECDEDRSSEAARGQRGRAAPRFAS